MEREGIGVRLGLNTTEFERGLKNADSWLHTWSKRITLGLGAGFGIAEIKNFFGGVVEKVHELNKAAKATSFSVEGVQSFQKMTKAVWDSATAMDKLGKLNEMIGGARLGEKSAIKYFQDLGVAIDIGGKARTTEAILRDLLDAWANEQDIAKRSKLLSDAFKKGGEDIAAYVEGGSKSFDKLSKQWSTISAEEVKQIEAGRAAWRSMWEAIYNGAAKATAALLSWDTIVKNTKNIPSPYSGMISTGKPSATTQPSATGAAATSTPAQLEEIAKLEEELRKKIIDNLSNRDKEKILTQDILEMRQALALAEKDKGDYQNVSLQVQMKEIDAEKLRKEIAKETASIEEKKKNLTLQRTDAETRVRQAKADLQTGIGDRTAFTLDEIAAGTPIRGNAFVNQQIFAARRVKFLEAYGKAARGAGRGDIAREATAQALNLRGGMEALTTSERYPMAAMTQAVQESNRSLADIQSKLNALLRVTNDPE